MHEFSIAQSIIDIAEEIATKEKADQIQSIDIEIGALSGVVLDALEFALKITVGGTILGESQINFSQFPERLHVTIAISGLRPVICHLSGCYRFQLDCLSCHTHIQISDHILINSEKVLVKAMVAMRVMAMETIRWWSGYWL